MKDEITMTPVNSLSIKAVGYDDKTGTLAIDFASGGRYQYRGVSAEAHEALMNAPSIGKHFHQHIKSQFFGEKQSPPVLVKGEPVELGG